jgi:hypothetical protein
VHRRALANPLAGTLSVLAVLTLALLFVSRADAGVRIVAPSSIQASRPVHFAAATSGPTSQVSFYVDGRRRWVDHGPGWRVGHTLDLRPGRHTLKVRAIQAGRAVTSSRTTVVEPSRESIEASVEQSEVRPTEQGDAAEEAGEAAQTAGEAAEEAGEATQPSPTTEVPTGGEASGQLLFSGSQIRDFADNQSAPGAVSEVPDPAGSGAQVLKMDVENSDVAPLTPTDNPRAQLLTPAFVKPGDETWWHTSFYLPADFPKDVPGWVNVIEGPYGPPYDGSPPVAISIEEDEIRFQRGDTYDYDVPWHEPIERGKWVDVLLHTRFGSNGFVELWIDGQQVTFFDNPEDRHNFNPFHEAPTQHLEMATMDHTNDGGPNFFVLQNYREAGMFKSLTLYHGPTEVGTSREAVEAG